MPETYSREGSFLIGKESSPNTAVIPSVSVPINDEGLSESYGYVPSTPVEGNRMMNLRAVLDKITAPNGSINLNVEPKTFGYFLEGIGDLISGVRFASDDAGNGDIAVGDTISNGSTGTGTVAAIIVEENIIIATGVSGDWATGNTITNGGTHSSTLQTFSATVFSHLLRVPGDIGATYTLQRNYSDRAVRFMGAYFHGLDNLAQSDNIITAGVQVIAQSALRHAYVTAAVTSGAGAKSIPVDQTQGFVATDSIRVWRPGAGFLDFSASGVKTHTIGTVDSANGELDITNLETSLAAGDIIVLAPITPSYSIDEEFPWVGGSQMYIGADKDNLAIFDCQDYTMVLTYEMEEKHSANGVGIENRFPSDIHQKGLTGSGSFTLFNEDEFHYLNYRRNTAQAIKFNTIGNEIGATGINYELTVMYPEVQLDPYDMPLSTDEIINEEVPFTPFYNSAAGFGMQILLTNDVSSY